MKRRDLLKGGLGASTLASAVIGSTSAGAQDAGQARISWRMTSSYPKSLDAVYSAGETFIKVVSEIADLTTARTAVPWSIPAGPVGRSRDSVLAVLEAQWGAIWPNHMRLEGNPTGLVGR
jgi:hypothetical protein